MPDRVFVPGDASNAVLIRRALQSVDQILESFWRIGPFPFSSATLDPGTLAAVVGGELTALSSGGTWVGEGAIGVVGRTIEAGVSMAGLQVCGTSSVEYDGDSSALSTGTRLYASSVAGKAIAGPITSMSAHAYQIGFFIEGDSGNTSRVRVWLAPQPLREGM